MKRLTNIEINEIISDKLKTSAIADIYATIAHNPHLSVSDAVKIGAVYGNTPKCNTYGKWNEAGVYIKRGAHSKIFIPQNGNLERETVECFFTVDQTTAAEADKSTRTAKSLIEGLNTNTVMKITATEYDFSAIVAAVINYADENGISYDAKNENAIFKGIASILAYTCADSAQLNITTTPYPEQDYRLNANLLKMICKEAQVYLELVEQAETATQVQTAAGTKQALRSSTVQQVDGNTQTSLFDTGNVSDTRKPEIVEPQSSWKSAIAKYYNDYLNVKQQYADGCIVLSRLGDFFEILGDDAKKISAALELTLTGRDVGLPDRVPMCGLPYHVIDNYVQKILGVDGVNQVVVVEPLDAENYSTRVVTSQEAHNPPITDRKAFANQILADSIRAGVRSNTGAKLTIYKEYQELQTRFSDTELASELAKQIRSEYFAGSRASRTIYGVCETVSKGLHVTDSRIELDITVPWYDLAKETIKLIEEEDYLTAEEKSSLENRREDNEQVVLVTQSSETRDGSEATFEENNDSVAQQAQAEAQRRVLETGVPHVLIQWSENANFATGEILSLPEADKKFAEIDKNFSELGYDKVAFELVFKKQDELEHYEGRYDIGDKENGLINHIENYLTYSISHDTFIHLSEEEKTERLEFIKYLKSNINSIDIARENTPIEESGIGAPPREALNGVVVTTPLVEETPSSGTIEVIEEDAEIASEEARLTFGGAKTRFADNLAALKLLRKLQEENRAATAQEKQVLKKYVGWGGISEVFDLRKDNWHSEREELKTLLSDEEYRSASLSVTNAFYTPYAVIKGIYAALERFGVKGGNRILEPSMGVGNFFRVMPEQIRKDAKLFGVELDTVTGEIAQKIYPEADIKISGFERVLVPRDSYDVVVGNVPFDVIKPKDLEKDYKMPLHSFIIAKSVDKTRAGGIIALITTSATMDNYENRYARKYIADSAELLGAVRLPYDAFKANANTEVSTDVLFLQKRAEKIDSNDEWLDVSSVFTADGHSLGFVNKYFQTHPEMVLGDYKYISTRYGTSYKPFLPDGKSLAVAFSEAVEKLPANIFENIQPAVGERATQVKTLAADENVPNLCYTVVDNEIYQRKGEVMEQVTVTARVTNAIERVKAMTELRSLARQLLDIQNAGCSDAELSKLQTTLSDAYDNFVNKFGVLHSRQNVTLMRGDADFPLLISLENKEEETGKISKSIIFSQRSINPYIAPTHTDNVVDALQISKNERGVVDIKYIEQLTDKDYDTVIAELGNYVFKNPELANERDKYQGYEPAETYLSGDVKNKLAVARNAAADNPEFNRNVTELELVQPEEIPADKIAFSLGATWIDEKYYTQFLAEQILDTKNRFIKVKYLEITNQYLVDTSYVDYQTINGDRNNKTFGTGRISAIELFKQAINLKTPLIKDKVSIPGTDKYRDVVNVRATAEAREKQSIIQREFKQWLFSDIERRTYLAKKYNDLINRFTLPQYDGSAMTFPGMNTGITLRPHQRDAIYRGLADGTVLLHHAVGAGKTYEMDALAMKLRQTGLAHKPLMVVPKATLQQAVDEFKKLYPAAKVLAPRDNEFDKEHRKEFAAKIAMGDWDCVIMSSSQFDIIKVSDERQSAVLAKEIDRAEKALKEQQEARNNLSAKKLAAYIKTLQTKLQGLMDKKISDDYIRFEELGVDYLLVDEAHEYKNRYFFTKMTNVKGLSSTESQRAMQMALKIDYINELHGGDKGVIFATGTPISNTMSELYVMLSYLQNNRLKSMGLDNFDNWAAAFGEITHSLELKPDGKNFQPVDRFASYVNIPELMKLYGLVADIKVGKQLQLNVPTAKYVKKIAPNNDLVTSLMENIAQRAAAINAGGVNPREDNMLKVTSDGKKIALDVRLFDNALPETPSSKLQICAEQVAEIYRDTANTQSTQIIFCDSSTPKSEAKYEDYNPQNNFNVYYELKRKLVALGVKEEEIAFIHDYEKDADKKALFQAMNSGKMRVLVGSTQKCGTGVNIQNKLIACHHLDIPYRPSDMEQREGRIIRQGNENKNVTIYTYAQEGTFDAYLFQILENKQKFISQLLDFKIGGRTIEDFADDTTLSYGEMKAAISGDPRVMELEQLKHEIRNLEILESSHAAEKHQAQLNAATRYPAKLEMLRNRLVQKNLDVKKVSASANQSFTITLTGEEFTERNIAAGEAFNEAYRSVKSGERVCEYRGFDVRRGDLIYSPEKAYTLVIHGANDYKVVLGDSGIGNLMRLENAINAIPDEAIELQKDIAQTEKDLEEAKRTAESTFELAAELTEKTARLAALTLELEIDGSGIDDVIMNETEDNGDNGGNGSSNKNIYRRLPLEYMDKEDIYKTIARNFNQQAILTEIESRLPEVNPEHTVGTNYENIAAYTIDDLRATLENWHRFLTKNGFEVMDLYEEGSRTYAIIHRQNRDDYLVAYNYNVKTGEWGQGKYDFSSLETAYEYCQNSSIKLNEVSMNANEIKQIVQERIQNEFEAYKANLIKKSPENIFYSSFETYVKTEISDTIVGEETLSDEVYRALYAEGEGVLNELYLDFIGSDTASVNSFDDTADFIEEYCRQYQSAIMDGDELGDEESRYYETMDNAVQRERNVSGLSDKEQSVIDLLIEEGELELLKERVDKARTSSWNEIKNELLSSRPANAFELSEILGNYRSYSSEYAREMISGYKPQEQLIQEPLFGVVYNWKGLKEENYIYTAEQLQNYDPNFNPELEMQDGAFAANKTYIVYKLSGVTAEETLDNIKAFLTGDKNDTFDGAEIPEGWYWETKTDDLFTGNPNLTTISMIKYLNLTEDELRMKEETLEQFVLRQLKGIVWLDGRTTGFTDDEIEDIKSDLKPAFENSVFDGSNEAMPYDEWYDDFSETELEQLLRQSVTVNHDKIDEERARQIAREDFPRDFADEDPFTEALLDSIEDGTFLSGAKRPREKNDKTDKHEMAMPSQSQKPKAQITLIEFEDNAVFPIDVTANFNALSQHLRNSTYDQLLGYLYDFEICIRNNSTKTLTRDKWIEQQKEDAAEFYDMTVPTEHRKAITDVIEVLSTYIGEAREWQQAKKNSETKKQGGKSTLGEDLANRPKWHKVVLPKTAAKFKNDKNYKIVMPDDCANRGEFWVSKKFIKKETSTSFELVLPDNYTVRLSTPNGELALPSKQVIEDLANSLENAEALSSVKNTLPRSDKQPLLDFKELDELKMSDARKELVQQVVTAMESGDAEWLRSWATVLPQNAISGREYKGINNLLLTAAQIEHGYTDNRWLTFNQITEKGWKLRKGSKAEKIEVVKLYDKSTKKDFDQKSVEGLTEEEKQQYFDKNVTKVMKSYSVFNASCVEGIPAVAIDKLADTERHAACEKILANSPATVYYDGGNDAYYSPGSDSIHLPQRTRFFSTDDFYHVALHEVGHSTGHRTRLNRDLTGMSGTEKYAKEELCAELGSLFISQKLGIKISDKQLVSSAAYLKGWSTIIKNDPKYLFKAISEAAKIEQYVLQLQNGEQASQKAADERTAVEDLQRGAPKPVVQSSFLGVASRNSSNTPNAGNSAGRNKNIIME